MSRLHVRPDFPSPYDGGMARIEDYALLGDLQTAALVEPDGLDRLVLLPALRLGCLFRGASRHPRARALAARSGRRGPTLDPALPARHADPRVGLRDRRGQREGDRVHAAARRRARHRAHRGGPGRKRPDALRARDPVRLRQDRPLGAAGRSCPGGDRRPRRPLPPHAGRDPRRGDDDGLGVHDRGRRADPVRAHLVPVARAAAATRSTPRWP